MKGANLVVLLTTTVKDRNGKVVSKKTRRSRSFNIAFLQGLECQTYPSMGVTITDEDNAPQAITEHEINFKAEALATSAVYGILVGIGTTPVTNTDYTMETLIAHGTGAGQLSYGSTSKVTTAEVGANVDLQIIRAFSNTSGNTINVTEFGMKCIYVTVSKRFLILHDVETAVPVLNGQTLTVTYTFRTTV